MVNDTPLTQTTQMPITDVSGACLPAATAKNKTPANKEIDKQVKSLSAKVKELEEKSLYLSRENNDLRKQKTELELEVRREKQITNMHLKLTKELSDAREALKNAPPRVLSSAK